MRTWAAGAAGTFASGSVKKPGDGGVTGVTEASPRTAAGLCGRVVRARRRAEGPRGLGSRTQRVPTAGAAPAARGSPCPSDGRVGRGPALGRWRRGGHVAPAPAPAGSASLGTWLSLHGPPSASGVGDELQPREPRGQGLPRLLTRRGAPAPSFPLPCPDGGGRAPAPRTRGALGPICTSVLADAGELAQQLPPLIPHPHPKYLGIERGAEWTLWG